MAKKKISRRRFLVRGGLGTLGVVAVGTYVFRNPIRRKILEQVDSGESPYLGSGMEPMLWFEITKENHIILHSPKVEMGQGTFTGLAQIAADELEVDMGQISVVHAASASGNMDSFATGGSTSIMGLWQPLRELAATMREILKNQVAKTMGGATEDMMVSKGVISIGDKSFTYAEIAAQTTSWEVPDTPALKEVSEYQFVGKPIPRVDLEDKVYGAPIFGMDAEMPNMLYGAVVRPDKIGAIFKSANTTKAAGMPGVVAIVEEDDFVGVVADSYVNAERAKEAIEVNWEVSENWQTTDIREMTKVGKGDAFILQKEGGKLTDEEDILKMEFFSPIGAHAQLEPNGVLAFVEGDRATLKISTQVVALTQKEVAKRLHMDEGNINIIPTFLGGGFGRRLHTPHAVQAAVMSKAVGKPVKYFFSRKEEFQHDLFRPPTHHELKGKLNAGGNIEYLQHDFSSGDVAIDSAMLPGFLHGVVGTDVGAIRGGMCQYRSIPNLRTISWHVELPFATSWWRSLGLLANTFAWESFMDALAVKAHKNPVDFRLAHIPDDKKGKRLKAVIKAAAERANYVDKSKNGRAMGFAASTDAGTPCAQVAEVSIENNEIKVHKVICAMDPGIAVNPDQVRAQCEGAIIMGMSASLYEKMEVVDGALTPTIYGPYQMAMMRNAPKEIDVILLQGMDRPGAVGEPPLGPIGAAIANAVFRLTEKRLTELPLKLA